MSRVLAVCLVLLAAACGSSDNPSRPTTDSLTAGVETPGNGATVLVPEQYPFYAPGGVVLPPGSGLVSVRVQMTSAHDVPWAQLNVYLLTGGKSDEYCGQNMPDSPTWQFLTPGWSTTVHVSGFQVFRLPCEVTGIRAMLHMRNNGLLTPPRPSETIAEATIAASFSLQR